jgi:alanine dehydrogenase
MKIGITKEISEGERRVAIVPNMAAKLKKAGHDILVESDAGEAAFFPTLNTNKLVQRSLQMHNPSIQKLI